MGNYIKENIELRLDMERMQNQLYKLVEQKGSFLAPEVIELSQEIDNLVIAMQRMLNKYPDM
ncbi:MULTISPECIES: aspartyl-phosphate phosphatase Spo0E family protein [Paenibacillus]|uniref:Aspartyl-phosphate phosphatase Spo0E family protein n=1 Tax=Paenibacillus radicis (ex Xue et al. 2023) TaxID=2972489 RepID=A0ABT1YEY1_9BACL|nr:aspartyl-phosphate phosphatase Spo0E family protein [Paenibacillus radicis (ex Xue et al. 2023)]MCR8631757.1 aspartyl-phosphate phosphatase Spo0E family protein [Paenibacillus radicis (ex Xue et al. 2023)]